MRIALCITAFGLFSCKNPLVVKDYLNLVSLSPSQGATQVALDTNVIAGFSEPLVGSSVDSQSAYITDIDGNPVVAAAVYESEAHWVVLDPEADLTANTTYIITFTSAIKGQKSGNLISPVQTQFTTTGLNPVNELPNANAGPDLEINVGAVATLDGSSSFDPEGNPVSYSWRFISRPATSETPLSTRTGPETNFTADAEGEYIIGLIVNDGIQDSSEDFVIVKALGETADNPDEDTGLTNDTGGSSTESDDPTEGEDTGV